MRIRLLLSIVVIISLCALTSTQVSGAEFIKGLAALSDNLKDGTTVKVAVRTGKLSPTYPYKDAFMWGGDMRGRDEIIMPKTVITEMNIQIGNEKIIVPLSAYSDLGNPYLVSLVKEVRGFRLIIKGRGGTGTSYKAVLEFHGVDIQHRKVILSIFPDEVWQETTYSFISENSEK
jgi:hypothetical protein